MKTSPFTSLLLGPTANLKRLPIGVDLQAVSIAEGMRAALSIAVLVAADQWLQWPPLLEAALAALLTCLCDTGGPILQRIRPLVSFALLGALITAVFGLLRGLDYGVIPLASGAIFCLSLMRIYGTAAQQIGNLSIVTLVLALDRTLPGLAEAALLAGVFIGGSLWALLLTLVLWRVRPFRPVRRALAGCYRAVGAMAADLLRLDLAEGHGEEQEWAAHARAYRRHVRTRIETARAILLDVLRGRGGASERASVYLIRLEIAEQIFAALLALSDLLEPADDAALHAGADRFLRRLRPIMLVLAEVIEHQHPERLVRVARSLDALAGEPGASATLTPIVEAVVDRLRAFISLETPSDRLLAPPSATKGASLRERLMVPLRANLDRDSAALRHAARSAVVSAVGFAITITWEGPYQHWLTIVMVMTMQPFYALTLQRALERIGGTALGGVMATGIAMVCRTPLSMALAVFPLAVASLSFRPASYAVFITLLTPLVVLLSEFSRGDANQLEIAAMRGLYTVIGGLLAIGGALFLWPSWEPDRLARELRAAIAAHGRYAATELSLLLGEASEDEVDQMRRAAGIASNNLEASLSRALQEPRGQGRDLLEAAMAADAALRRMAGRLSAMQLGDREADPVWRLWRDWVSTAMTGLAQTPPVFPAKRPPAGSNPVHVDSLERLGRQIELIAGVLGRMSARPA